MNCSNTFEYLLILISLVSLSCGICVQKSCPLGTFCPIDTNCSGDTSLCVTECNLEISQGNWSSGNCELVPEEYNYWLDATFYEVLISSQLNAGTVISSITFSVARLLQSDDEDDILFSGSGSGAGSGLGSGILSEVTFNLETDHSFFKLKNGDTSHAVLSNKVNVASLAETGTIVTASSNPIPLGDYEMQVSVTRGNNVLRSSGVVIHVVETLPSILPAQTTCVEFEFSEYTVTESAGMLRVTLLLLGREQQVSFNVTVIANNTGSSSAIAGVDFTPGRYNATFTPGATKATTVIPIMIDNLPEDTEQFDLRLYIDGAGYELGLQNGNIRNAKAFIIQPNITGIVVEFRENVYSVVEDIGIYNVTVVKQGNSLQDIVVNIIPAPETAKLRFDYSLASVGSITFTPDGPNERTVQLSVDADQLLELNETYLLRLDLPAASITAGVQIGTIYQARVTIINDDRIQVFFKQKFVETKELEDVIIQVGFSPQKTTIPFTVRVETFDLTPPVAQAGIDYQPLIQNITFSQLAASVPIEIKIIENNITDGNRIFGLRLVIPEESKQLGIQLGTPSESNITIVDDDVGDLELTCYTTTNGDVISGHSITLHCKANQIVAYSCSVNNQSFHPCFNPYVIRAVDTRNPVNIGVNAIAPGVAPVSLTLTALTATAKVQIVGNGAIAVYIQSSKNATFRCRLNDGQLRTCVDGQMFDGLIAGTYTVTVDARGIENMRDVASYTVGPVVIVAGVNATVNEDIAHSPVVSVTPSSITATEGDSVIFTCIVTGVGASDFTYEWLINGNLMQGINKLNYTITVSESTVGNYTCIVKNQFGGSSQSNTAILNLKLPFCNSVTVTYSGFSITWNETQVGDTVEALCTGVGLTGTVRRSCIRRDIWEEFVECIREEINVLMEEASDLISDLDKITDMEIISIVDDIVVELANLTLPEQAQMHLTSEFVVVVDVLSLLNNVTETVINTLQPNDTFFERTVQVLDNLLSTINENSWQQLEEMSPSTSQKFIANIERFGRLLGETLNREVMEFIEARENIVIKAEIVTEESISSAQRPYMFPDNDDSMDSFTGRSGQVLLPNMLLKEVLDKLPEDSTRFVITNFVLRDGSLPLPNPPNGSATKEPVSSIISSQLPIPIDDTMHPITLIFDVPPTTLDERNDGVTNHLQHTCEFYDHTLSFNGNQTGAWSTVGIKLDKSRSNKTTVTCLSTHLTSFAVLVGNQNETQPPLVDDKQTLSVVIYIGSAICLGCLIISIIILGLALYNNKGKAKLIFVHLNLCIALALGLVVLIAGIENATDDRVSCVVVAVLLQYFFTSALCWMFSEGVMLYMMLVTVFSNKLNRLWFFFALGWGPAIPIVAISLGITHEQYGTDDHCWIESGKGALAAFILPILIVIVITCAFLMISVRLLYANQRKSNSEKRNSTRNTVKALLIITIIFLPLLGITWIFGILAVNEESAVFAWIFAILNAILGTLIFVFHVASDDQVGFNKKIKACYKSETFFTFYSGIRYYTVSRNSNNGKSRSATGIDKTSDHTHQVEMSTSVDSIEDQSTTTTTFKPPEFPLEDREVKKDPIILMAINPLEETALSEDGNTVALRQEIAVKEETTSVPTNEH